MAFIIFGILMSLNLGARAEGPPASAPAKKMSHDQKVEDLQQRRDMAHSALTTLNQKKPCDGDGECDALESGWRHCGGPTEYVIVSNNNPKLKDIQEKIKEITRLEREIAQAAPPADCTPAPKIPQVHCSSNQCKAKP